MLWKWKTCLKPKQEAGKQDLYLLLQIRSTKSIVINAALNLQFGACCDSLIQHSPASFCFISSAAKIISCSKRGETIASAMVLVNNFGWQNGREIDAAKMLKGNDSCVAVGEADECRYFRKYSGSVLVTPDWTNYSVLTWVNFSFTLYLSRLTNFTR